jgi:hypothetical protein
VRVLVVADSDSYLKWGVSRAREFPSTWAVEVIVIDNAVTPSARQRADAVAGRWVDVPVESLAEVAARLEAGVDILLLACRGPLIDFLFAEVLSAMPDRPVVAAGIPGLWFPPTHRGLDFRADVDVLIVHSERERAAVAAVSGADSESIASGMSGLSGEIALKRERGQSGERGNSGDRGVAVALATLVGGAEAGDIEPADGIGAVVFAPQALVPSTRAQREQLLDGLIRTARAHPSVPVLIKLRGDEDEAQTHREFASFPQLARERRDERPRNLRFVRGPLSAYLGGARGLVTVSSTAALESIAAGVPTMVLDDFGVSQVNLNEVFQGSGLWGSLEALQRLEFPSADAGWMRENYFHDADASDWVEVVSRLAADSRALGEQRRRKPARLEMTGARARVQRLRVRAQALGHADTRWRRWTTGVVVRPALAVRGGLVRRSHETRVDSLS